MFTIYRPKTNEEVKFAVGACVVLQEPRRAISVGYNGRPDSYKGTKDDYGTNVNINITTVICTRLHVYLLLLTV